MATEAQLAKQAKLLVVEDDVLIRTLLADMQSRGSLKRLSRWTLR